MIEHIPGDDRRQFFVVEHVDALWPVADRRSKQLQPEGFGQARQGNLRCSNRVRPTHTAFGQAHAQTVDEFALADTVSTRRGHHAENDKLIAPGSIPAMRVASEAVLQRFDEGMVSFIELSGVQGWDLYGPERAAFLWKNVVKRRPLIVSHQPVVEFLREKRIGAPPGPNASLQHFGSDGIEHFWSFF